MKSLPSIRYGPRTRVGLAKLAVVDQSTHMRAGRSLRVQTMAPSALGSPLCTPWAICGRMLSRVMMAGADWAKLCSGATTVAPVSAVVAFKKVRRSIASLR